MQIKPRESDCYHRLARYIPMPQTILDVGAAEGTMWLFFRDEGLFQQARHVFIDCMVENEPLYQKMGAAFGTDYIIGAMGETEGNVNLRIDRSPYLTQRADHALTGIETIESRPVQSYRLDQIVRQRGYQGPFLLRLDVQGAEAMVLAGADGLVPDTPVVTVEISFTMPPATTKEVWAWMEKHQYQPFGLVNWDFGALSKRMTTVYLVAVKRGLVPEQPNMLNQLLAQAQQDSAPHLMSTLTEAARRLHEAMA